MKPVVIDASLIAAAFFQEDFADKASAMLSSGQPLHAPGLVYPEVSNVISKRFGRSEISKEETTRLQSDLLLLPLEITSSQELVEVALQLAIHTKRTVYDCLYLALAMKTGGPMITCDQRLVNALAAGPLKEHVVWIGQEC